MLEPLTLPTPDQELVLLQPLAERLIWWQFPEQPLRHPDRVIAQLLDVLQLSPRVPLGWALDDRTAIALRYGHRTWQLTPSTG